MPACPKSATGCAAIWGAEATRAAQKRDLDAARQALAEVQARQRALEAEAVARAVEAETEAGDAQAELETARKALFEVETWRQELETQLTARSAEAARYAADLAAQNARLAETERASLADRSRIEASEQQLAERANAIEALATERKALHAQLAEVEAYKTMLLNSTSWRLTRPLRWLALRLRAKYRNRS
jgi:chromosome segregation ATPase